MKQLVRLFRYCAAVLVLTLPSATLAQTSLTSDDFQLTDINFASIFSLIPDDEGVTIDIIVEGPTVTTLEPTKAIIQWNTVKSATGTIQYGLTDKYGQETGSSTRSTKHSVTLFGLTPETTYHFKAVSKDASGATAESADKTFTTPPELGINSISISKVTYSDAVVSWTTAALTKSSVEYGTTTAYGRSEASGSSSFTTKHTVLLKDLAPGTEYHLRIKAENDKGASSTSSDLTFTTIAVPVFTSIVATPTSPNEVTIRWVTNTPTNGLIKYRLADKTEPKDELTAGETEYNTVHTTILRGLEGGNKKYVYEITASDEGGKQVKSGQKDFNTLVDREPPKIDKLQVTTALAGDRIIFTAKWITNEPAIGKVKITNNAENSDTQEIPGSDSYGLNQVVVGANLKPSRPYTLEAQAIDSSGNLGKAEIRFVTPKETKNVFKLIAEKFGAQFGWLLRIIQNN